MGEEQPKKASSTGLDENIAMFLSYLAGWVTGIVFYVIEKENRNVRFSAMQSIVVFGGLTAIMILCSIVSLILGSIPVLGHIFSFILWGVSTIAGIGGFILWVILIVKSLQGEIYRVPYAGEIADKYLK